MGHGKFCERRVERIPFRIPEHDELPDRLESVVDSIYAGFAEGWVDATGADPARRELAGRRSFSAEAAALFT
ncbi:hypothetical protein [Tunturiibacter gelidiferens]|uniref:Uncharacterized protein n=1 Tax=Tunturiibacter gelidiferens TaxID=3069689 RepID=A0AAU7YZW0_9BACT